MNKTLRQCTAVLLALLTMMTLVFTGAVPGRAQDFTEAPAVGQADSGLGSAPWWQGLPGWLQSILRYLFFGWIWMKQPIMEINIYFPDDDGKGIAFVWQGETIQLAANVIPSNAANKKINWSLDCDASIATISSTGLLTAKNTGDPWCQVRVRAEAADGKGAFDTVVIGIDPPYVPDPPFVPAEIISISGPSEVGAGSSIQLTAAVLPVDATDKTVTWSIEPSSTGSATIDSGGLLSAYATGPVYVTATANDGYRASDTRTIYVVYYNKVTGVAFNGPPSYTLNAGNTQALSWTVSPANATNKGVVFFTSDSTVATVSAGGVVTAVGGGTCTITVMTTDPQAADNYTYSITITVPVVLVTSIGISGAASVNVGGSAQYIATVNPTNATNKTVTWSIEPSSTGSATINNNGLLTATAVGYVDIKAAANDASGVSDIRRITIVV